MLTINARSSTPIYEQIIIGVKELILRGLIKPGEKLPSVRELSILITANPNTISKAYRELEKDGIIETLRGKGTYIVQNYQPKDSGEKVSKLDDCLRKLILDARYLGVTKEYLINTIEENFRES